MGLTKDEADDWPEVEPAGLLRAIEEEGGHLNEDAAEQDPAATAGSKRTVSDSIRKIRSTMPATYLMPTQTKKATKSASTSSSAAVGSAMMRL